MNVLSPKEIVRALRPLMGDGGALLVEPAEMASYFSEPRKRFTTPAVAVALPAGVAALQALCRWANQHGVPLIPQSGNTGLVGGQVPLRGDEVIVNLARLNQVREVNAAAGYMTVEAGLILEEAHRVAENAGAELQCRRGAGARLRQRTGADARRRGRAGRRAAL